MVATKQLWLRRSLAFLLVVAIIMSMGIVNVFAVGMTEEMQVVSFGITEPTENGATLKMTRIPAGYDELGSDLKVYINKVSYLVLPLSEDSETPLDYAAVTAHEARVDITTENMDFAYPIYMGYGGNTYECAIEGLEPGTEYVLYGATAEYNAIGQLTEGTQECQRITFTTAGTAEEEPEAMQVVSFGITEPTENGITLKMTRIPAGYDELGSDLKVYINKVSYLVLPLSEDSETPLDYAAVTAHEARVDITTENMDFAYPIYMGYGGNTYECAIEGLEPGTEYVLYGATAEYNAIGQLTEGTQECQRITFTTAGTASDSYNLTIDAAEYGAVIADKSEYNAGDSVVLTVTPEEGYVLTSLYYTVESSEEQLAIDTDTKTFIMPAGNVTVFAVFTPAVEENAVMKLMYTESGSSKTQYFASYNDAIAALNALDNGCIDVTLTLLQNVDTGTTGIGETAIVVQRSCTLNLNGKTLSGKPAANGDAILGVTAETEDLSFTLTGGDDFRQ